jgi:hypothetical protein
MVAGASTSQALSDQFLLTDNDRKTLAFIREKIKPNDIAGFSTLAVRSWMFDVHFLQKANLEVKAPLTG